MLKVDQLTRNYGSFTAVDHVSFQIGSGEIIGLLGHNGAGKTTIMKMLAGYMEPSEGMITLDGEDISESPTPLQQILGYLPENLPVYPEMTVADYLDYSATLRGLEGRHKQDAVLFAISETELQDKALQSISTLSRGYKQRVGVAQAILHQPRLLILDEPTNGLDPSQTEQMRKLIKRLSEKATVILSTHIMQEVDAVCDRVLILRNGCLVLDENLVNLYKSNRMILDTDAVDLTLTADQVKGMASCEKTDSMTQANHCRYVLTAENETVMDDMAAGIAKILVEHGHAIYSLSVEKRDLESVYREANSLEVSHVA